MFSVMVTLRSVTYGPASWLTNTEYWLSVHDVVWHFTQGVTGDSTSTESVCEQATMLMNTIAILKSINNLKRCAKMSSMLLRGCSDSY